MSKKTYYKKDIVLKEDNDRNYAASTDASNATPSELVNKTKQEHSDADAVTIPGKEMDGNTSTQVATVNVQNTPQDLQNAQKMARTFQAQGQDVNFKVNLKNSVQREGNLVESVTFTKGELGKFLKTI
jgi:hypothetical protein